MLDRVDRLILSELDRNARIALSELARTLRLGRDIVEYRIDKLRDEGILKKTMVVINPHALGFMVFKCYLRLRFSLAERQRLFEWLKRKRSVFWIAETWGRFDAIFSALVRSPQDFDDLQLELLRDFPNLVLAHEMALTVDVLGYPRRHLTPSGSPTRAFHWGGQLQKYEIATLEAKLLLILAEDARLSLTELADRCSSTPIIVKRRLKQLADSGVVVGFRTQIDLSRIGLRYVKLQLEFAEKEINSKGATISQELSKFCGSCPHVAYLVHQLGRYRVEIESEEPFDGDYGIVLRELDAALGRYLLSAETLLISNDHHHRLRL